MSVHARACMLTHVDMHARACLQGVISIKTLTKLDRLRKGGVRLVLITGARLSTFLTRMAFLPAADAYVCENGGRIFYPNAAAPVAFPIGEDMNWRQRHNETGEASCNACWVGRLMYLHHKCIGKTASKAESAFEETIQAARMVGLKYVLFTYLLDCHCNSYGHGYPLAFHLCFVLPSV